MGSWLKVIFGDSRNMHEIPSNSVHLTVTSPPYFNAPFDYPGLFDNYDQFLDMMRSVGGELFRVTAEGRVCSVITDDVIVERQKYPVVADITRIMLDAGFRYRDKITWVKPKGYVRISRRSGAVLQHPLPMYFYPDNLQESILLFQKGKFDYESISRFDSGTLAASTLDKELFNKEEWHLTVWNIANVMPVEGRLEEGIAAFPEEIPRRLIRLFTFFGETVLDPFLGSGTTLKIAKGLGRNGYGYEIDLELKTVIAKKLGFAQATLSEDAIEMIERAEAKKLRATLQSRVQQLRSVVNR